MDKFQWQPSYSLHIEEIDNQHKTIVSILSEISKLPSDNSEQLPSSIDKLIEYCNTHFELETQFIEKINYPELEEHKELHNELRHHVEFYLKRIKNNLSTNNEIISFLYEWLKNHICIEDRRYADFFHNKEKNKPK